MRAVVLVLACLGLLVQEAAACAGGPKTYRFSADVKEPWIDRWSGEFSHFEGKVVAIKRAVESFAPDRVTFDVGRVVAGSRLAQRIEVKAQFGNFGGGCGQHVVMGEVGYFVVEHTGKSLRLRWQPGF